MGYIDLPKNEDQLAKVLETMLRKGKEERNINRVEWIINAAYMRGSRSFSNLNYQLGSVDTSYQSNRGGIEYRYEQVVRDFQTEMGRLLQIDERPDIDREGMFTLDGLRQASTALATLDNLLMDYRPEEVKLNFLNVLLMYGTAGLACWGQSAARLGRPAAEVEVIPPWELLPIPSIPSGPGDVRGIIRTRWVPIGWLSSKKGLKMPRGDNKGKLQILRVPYGENPELYKAGVTSTYGAFMAAEGSPSDASKPWLFKRGEKGKDQATQEWGELSETFLYNADGSLYRYTVMVGRAILLDEDYEEDSEPPMMPIGVARYVPTSGFYGRGFVSLVRPTNMEQEYLLRQLFENAQDLDQFGYLMLPTTAGIKINQLKSTTKPRYVMYEPDLTAPEHKPYAIQPANTRDFPGKVASYGRTIQRDLAGHSEMMAGNAPGRVDSAAALGFLNEMSATPLKSTASSIMSAYVTLYRAMLGMAREIWPDSKMAYVTRLDDSLVGLQLDAETGRIKLDRSAVPLPREVKLTIKAAVPSSSQQRKQELLELRNQGIISDREFRITSRIEGLGFPVGNRAEFENYRKAVLNNILLFNDGVTPGLIVASDVADDPEIHLSVLMEFVARPEFTLASQAVRSAFKDRKEEYQGMLGNQYPQQLEYPEDIAAEAQGGPESMPQAPPSMV